ncbi:MAG: type II toxin-antitoxin system HicA family toxin [Chloroflexota bacterium]
MPRKLRELRADLRRAGFGIDHQAGSHETWKHAHLPGVAVVMAGRDGSDAKPYQETQVRRALAALRTAEEERQEP